MLQGFSNGRTARCSNLSTFGPSGPHLATSRQWPPEARPRRTLTVGLNEPGTDADSKATRDRAGLHGAWLRRTSKTVDASTLETAHGRGRHGNGSPARGGRVAHGQLRARTEIRPPTVTDNVLRINLSSSISFCRVFGFT